MREGCMWVTNACKDLRYGVRLHAAHPRVRRRRDPDDRARHRRNDRHVQRRLRRAAAAAAVRRARSAGQHLDHAPRSAACRAHMSGMANVYDCRARNHVFEDIAALVRAVANFNLIGEGEPERLFGARVSANLFPVLARHAAARPRPSPSRRTRSGTSSVAILSYGLWQRRFGGDPTVVGRTISLSGVPHAVVGVMRQDFAYPTREYQIYTPLTFDPRGTRQPHELLVPRVGSAEARRHARAGAGAR